MSGTLYIVATPIGNLEDITLRALRILRESDLIAAEDTRVTRKLLSHYDIHTTLTSYHQHSKGRKAEELLRALLDGRNVALVSDAGTPGISDPGHELIALCIAEGVRVESIPGATAIITGLVVSGMSTSRFVFDGFPPRAEGDRRAYFAGLRREARSVCLYEAPYRLVDTLRSISEELGDRRVAVIREATKKFESVFRGSASEAVDRFSEGKVRGEIVIVIDGASASELAVEEIEPVALDERLRDLIESGMTERDAVRTCMIEFKLPKRQVYAAALALKAAREPSPEPES